MRTARPDRRLAHRRGRQAELIAAVWLVLHGYQILARGFRITGGEIDIVARRGSVLAFVEVKRRECFEDALLALTATKQHRVERAAAVWLSRHPWAAGLTFRGDAVLLAPRRLPRHLADAFPVVLGH